MKPSTLATSLLAAVLLAACSKATDTIIPSDMSKWDAELAPIVKKLSEEDQKLLIGYVMRAKVGQAFGGKEGIPMGTTVGDALDNQKKWMAEEEKKAAEAKALKEKMLKEQADAQAAIDNAATVTLIEKQQRYKNFDLRRFSDEQVFVIGVHNKSGKAIAGISGSLEFIDIFDKKVGGVSFRMTENIAPGGDAKWTGTRDYNQFIDAHKSVWNLEAGKFSTRFKPEAVVFADGTKLTVPN